MSQDLFKYKILKREHSNLRELQNSFPLDDPYSSYAPHVKHVVNSLTYIKSKVPDLSRIITNFGQTNTQSSFLVIGGLPRKGNQSAITFILASLLGEIIKIDGEGDFLMKVQEQLDADKSSPGYSNHLAFPFHTDMSYIPDPPDFLISHCIERDRNIGGTTVYCCVRCILAYLDPKYIEILKKKNFIFNAPSHFNGKQQLKESILDLTIDDEPKIRLRADKVTCDNKLASEALDALWDAIDICQRKTILQKGSAYIVNNRTALHGRSEFIKGKSRILNRIYINNNN